MSYDVHIGSYDFNYTFNLTPFFQHYIPGVSGEGLKGLDGLEGQEAEPLLLAALDAILDDLEVSGAAGMSERWDSPNGWGTWTGASRMISKMARACTVHPAVIINVFT